MAPKTGAANRQKAMRELQSGERTLSLAEILVQDLHHDERTGTVVHSSLKQTHDRCEKHLGPHVRWVYTSEDLDDVSGQDEEKEKRMKLLDNLQRNLKTITLFMPIVKCFHATPKEPLSYDVTLFAQHIEDAIDEHAAVPQVYIQRCIERTCDNALEGAIKKHELAWQKFVQDKGAVDPAQVCPVGAFDKWSNLVSIDSDTATESGLLFLKKTASPDDELLGTFQAKLIGDAMKATFSVVFADSDFDPDSEVDLDPDSASECFTATLLKKSADAYRIHYLKQILKSVNGLQILNKEFEVGIQELTTLAELKLVDNQALKELREKVRSPKHPLTKLAPTPIGEFLNTWVIDQCRLRILAERATRRCESLQKYIQTQNLDAADIFRKLGTEKLSASRWRETLRPLREAVMQYRKIVATSKSEELTREQCYIDAKKMLTQLHVAVKSACSERFQMMMAEAVSNIVREPDLKATVKALETVKHLISELEWTGLASDENDEENDKLIAEEREKLLDGFIDGINALDIPRKKDRVQVYLRLKAFVHFLIDVDVDGAAFVLPSAIETWKSSRSHKTLVSSIEALFDLLNKRLHSDISALHQNKLARIAGKLLNSVIESIEEGEVPAKSIGARLLASITGPLEAQMGELSPELIEEHLMVAWREAALPLFNKFENASVTLTASADEVFEHIDIKVTSACILNDFIEWVWKLNEMRAVARKKTTVTQRCEQLTVLVSLPAKHEALVAQGNSLKKAAAASFPSSTSALFTDVVDHAHVLLASTIVTSAVNITHQLFKDAHDANIKLKALNMFELVEKLLAHDGAGDDIKKDEAKAVMLVVDSKEAKNFKKMIKICNMFEKSADDIVNDLAAYRDPEQADFTELLDGFDKLMQGQQRIDIKYQLAHMAITQSSLRNLRPGEDRNILLQQAANCAIEMQAFDLPECMVHMLENHTSGAFDMIMQAKAAAENTGAEHSAAEKTCEKPEAST